MSNLLFYPPLIESAIARIEAIIRDRLETDTSPRSLALLLLQNDPETRSRLQQEPYFLEIEAIVRETQDHFTESLGFAIAQSRHNLALAIAQEVTVQPRREKVFKHEWLHHLTVHPLTGIPLLLFILYFGIYQFVGVLGGGILVDRIEGFFETQINPQVDTLVTAIIPWPILQDLFAHDYGIITLGIRYAIAIVLPVVATFFLMFSCLEDSGYLPRLSLLVDRIFKTMGLSGRSIIPLILGLGCGTMATLVTRTLESKRERVIATLLLALTIPCSAQLGVILALLSQEPA
ncbi:MAG: nucleoside recognition domain-containing protein, partial [Spirulinaceae cyanobacterium]